MVPFANHVIFIGLPTIYHSAVSSKITRDITIEMKLFALFGCFKEKFNSAIVEDGAMISTNFTATAVSASQNAMVGLSKTNQEKVLD